MRGVIKRGVMTLPARNRTAAAHFEVAVLGGCNSNAYTECGCERVSKWLLSQFGGCHIGACCCVSCCCRFNSNSSRRGSIRWSRRCTKSLLGSKERGDGSRLHCCGRSSCRSSRGAGGGILFSLHVHGGGLHRGSFPAHRGCVLCVIPRQKLYHPGDRRRGPVNVCGVNLRGGVILCNPGDNSPPRLKCQKISPGCGFLWVAVSYVGVVYVCVCVLHIKPFFYSSTSSTPSVRTDSSP